MNKQDLHDYKFSDIKHRMAEIDNELATLDSKDDGPKDDNIYAMMPLVQHKTDSDFMDQVE
jgi:hypothetical protein